jgi:hypothetical protein
VRRADYSLDPEELEAFVAAVARGDLTARQ